MQTARGFQALSDEQIMQVAPSVFAAQPWERVSQKYAMVPTAAILEGMRKEGFMPVYAQQSYTRIPGKQPFAKHFLRFRRVDALPTVGDTFLEVGVMNSHDGSSSYQLHATALKLACLNGLVCRLQTLDDLRIRHTGDIASEVIEASYRVVQEFPAIEATMQEWRGKTLTTGQQVAFAEAATGLRWDEGKAPRVEALLQVRRSVDVQDAVTLWGTYNRVQEALIRGGAPVVSMDENGRRTRRRAKAVTGIDQNVRLNRALWVLAEKLAASV